MQIIIKNKLKSFYPDLNARIVTGDVRAPMALETIQKCERVIDKYYNKKDDIWILIHSFPEPANRRIIRTKIIICDRCPPKMLGTVCFYVDYRISDVELLWALPLDTVRDPRVTTEKGPARIAEDVAGLPILN